MMNLNFLLHMIYITSIESITWIERSKDGDKFDVTCSTCHLYDSQCIKSNGWFGCCTECQCNEGYTVFAGLCHGDLSHKEIGCKFYMRGYQYYGLATNKFYNSITNIGWVMSENSWDKSLFTSCVVHKDSHVWDMKTWTLLFTNGRTKKDFSFLSSNSGVMLRFHGTSNNQQLYIGLLLKLKLTCSSAYNFKLTSCLLLKVAGKHYYNQKELSTTIITRPTSAKTYTTSKTATKPKTSVKPTSLESSTKVETTEHSRTPFTSPSHKPSTADERTRHLLTKILPILAVAIFFLLFCCVFVCCKTKRYSKPLQTRTHLLLEETKKKASYNSNEDSSSVELVTSSEFEIINMPSYSDVDELRIISQKSNRASSGIYYVNNLPDSLRSTLTSQSTNDSINSEKMYFYQ